MAIVVTVRVATQESVNPLGAIVRYYYYYFSQ